MYLINNVKSTVFCLFVILVEAFAIFYPHDEVSKYPVITARQYTVNL